MRLKWNAAHITLITRILCFNSLSAEPNRLNIITSWLCSLACTQPDPGNEDLVSRGNERNSIRARCTYPLLSSVTYNRAIKMAATRRSINMDANLQLTAQLSIFYLRSKDHESSSQSRYSGLKAPKWFYFGTGSNQVFSVYEFETGVSFHFEPTRTQPRGTFAAPFSYLKRHPNSFKYVPLISVPNQYPVLVRDRSEKRRSGRSAFWQDEWSTLWHLLQLVEFQDEPTSPTEYPVSSISTSRYPWSWG